MLFTFVFLFIFIGNLGEIKPISDFLKSVVNNNEVIVGVISSQVFSNVPAAILLSKFTENAKNYNSEVTNKAFGIKGRYVKGTSLADKFSYQVDTIMGDGAIGFLIVDVADDDILEIDSFSNIVYRFDQEWGVSRYSLCLCLCLHLHYLLLLFIIIYIFNNKYIPFN